jgi:4-hydroxy-2-oxoheptanedioate aldolase
MISPPPVQAEMLAGLGFDSFVVDLQHGDIDHREAVQLFTTIGLCGATPLARVSWNNPGEIMRTIDAGAYGIMCPMINSRAEAESFVAACRYPPAGMRSWGGRTRSTLYAGARDFEAYFNGANDEILTIGQIETGEALENIDDIVSTPGLDSVYVGPADLAASLGGSAKIDYADPVVHERMERIAAACVRHGVKLCLHAMTRSDLEICLKLGGDLISVTTDVESMMTEATRSLAEARAVVAEA